MPAKNSQPITKHKFNAVIKSLRLNSNVAHVAELHHLKESTIKAIRRAKTWDEYCRRKAVKASKVSQAASAKRAMNPAPRPVTKIPVTTTESPRTTRQPRGKYVTREEMIKEDMATAKVVTTVLSKRISRLEKTLADEGKADALATVKKAQEARSPFWKRIFGKVGR